MVLLYVTFGVALLCLVLCVKTLVDNVKMYNEYKVFNENIKNWAQSLDDSMNFALNQAAMKILSDMDARISEEKQEGYFNNNEDNLEKNEEN